MSPPSKFARPPALSSDSLEDTVVLSAQAKSHSERDGLSPVSKVAFASLAALSVFGGHTAQADNLNHRRENFEVMERLVYNQDELAPCGESVDLLREYAHSDFGAPVVAEIVEDAKQAVEDGMLTSTGELTVDGEFEGYQAFRISCGEVAQGGPNGIFLPASFPEHFKYSGQEVHPLAIVHHEMGHTKYGTPAQASDIVTDEHGSRYSVEHELEIVRQFENPVRELHGYAPRTSYTNHLGETAKLPDAPSE